MDESKICNDHQRQNCITNKLPKMSRCCKVVRNVQSTQNLARIARIPIIPTIRPKFQATPDGLDGKRSTFAFRCPIPSMNSINSTTIKTTTNPVNVDGGSMRSAGGKVSINFRGLYYKEEPGMSFIEFLKTILQFAIFFLKLSVKRSSLMII